VLDHAEPLELLQVAIDGGEVDVGRLGLDELGQLLGAAVPRHVEQGMEEEAP